MQLSKPAKPSEPWLLTYGDSNTHGTQPLVVEGERFRYPPDVRWPSVAAARLGWNLIEEGLPGRTTCLDDAEMGAHMSGRLGLSMALESHVPVHFLTIMLGTNDLKAQFARTAEQIAADAGRLIDLALSDDLMARHRPGGYRLLFICPPVVEEIGWLGEKFRGGAEKSRALAKLYEAEAERRGVAFLDAGAVISPSAVDGVHFPPEAHLALGEAVAEALAALADGFGQRETP